MRLGLVTLVVGFVSWSLSAAEPEHRLFELRTATAAPGKWPALQARFKSHVVGLFERHGAETVGYFLPADAKTQKVVYLLAFKDLESRDATMAKIDKDAAWAKAFADSEANGPLAKDVTSTFLTATDYSPKIKTAVASAKKTFELRTYTSTKGNLDALNDRFRGHTVKLFEKHGMTNFGYWLVANVPQPKTNPLPRESTLIYLLAHDSEAAAKKSFDAFRADPVWVKAKAESEKKAGGSLTEAKNGVLSEFLKPAEWTPKK
jgi:hypothetical protein